MASIDTFCPVTKSSNNNDNTNKQIQSAVLPSNNKTVNSRKDSEKSDSTQTTTN